MATAEQTQAGGAREDLWIASGLRTPFAKVDGALAGFDAIALSVPTARAMVDALDGAKPDLAVWGAVAPNLGWSNLAREVMLDAKLDPSIPAFSTVMACATSMMSAIEAAGMLDGRGRHLALAGGVESMSHIQIGLTQTLSDWLRHFFDARTLGQRVELLKDIQLREVKLYIPSITNRSTGKSMGEHTEEMAKTWHIPRADEDALALESHQRAVAAWKAGFFADIVIPFAGLDHDTIPRPDTSLEKLARLKPVFDRTSGQGSLTAGNASPLTDGSAAIWVADGVGLQRVPDRFYRARLVDWEIGAIDLWHEGLLMAPAYCIPRLLARHDLHYEDIQLWEIHEAFSAQVLCHIKALQDRAFLRDKVGVDRDFGRFPQERMNPNGGSVALGHPFGATGARILSQAVKELSKHDLGARAIVSICTDGGLGAVCLLER
ncbi:MAG TPA: acetyl-CoA C-acyltransferase [Caulobacteraceae bacterium]|jgi:acetyl-CoA C-acetyltransferase|nr:acetyl-CoA C-acyltransferase [Caulobacteraceae bacterium]